MSKISERLGYIHGMMDGLKMNQADDSVKLMGMIVDVLDEISSTIDRIESDQQDLSDYVESIDDDLADLEMQYGEEDFSEGEDDEDFDMVNDAIPSAKKGARLSILRDADEIDDEEDEDEFDFEEAETELYVGCVCPECGKFFSIKNPDDYDDDQKFECPFCEAHVKIEPMDLSSVPTAEPVID